jgi:hypothetical protein
VVLIFHDILMLKDDWWMEDSKELDEDEDLVLIA